jgi:anti-anti-sigma regulatory factor
MVYGNNTCEEAQGKFVVAGMQPHVASVVKLTGINKIITFAENVEEARKLL